jgi:hypothetical protein
MTSFNDLKAGAHVNIDERHAQTHRGKNFHSWILDRTLSSGQAIGLGFRTPDNHEVHLDIEYTAQGAATLEVIEDCSWNPIADVNIFNKNRIINTPSRLKAGPGENTTLNRTSRTTGENGGTTIFSETVFFDPKMPKTLGPDKELDLAKDTPYVVKLTADVDNNQGYLCLHWYELQDVPYRKARSN